jgi:hypothetical protein
VPNVLEFSPEEPQRKLSQVQCCNGVCLEQLLLASVPPVSTSGVIAFPYSSYQVPVLQGARTRPCSNISWLLDGLLGGGCSRVNLRRFPYRRAMNLLAKAGAPLTLELLELDRNS